MESQHGRHMMSTMSGDNHGGLAVGQNMGTINFHGSADHEVAKILEGLSSPYRQQKDLNPRRTTGTCEWLLQDTTFINWRDTLRPSLLHIYAAPGSGKSVLARCLIDEKLLSDKQDTPILYFFFKRGQGEQDRSTKALAAMLHQLYTEYPTFGGDALRKSMIHRYKKHSQKIFGMFNELFEALVSSVTDINREVICVFDALDECEECDREQLSSALATLFVSQQEQPSSAVCGLKIVLTSRPDSRIEDIFAPVQHLSNIIRLDGYKKHESIAREINLAIEDMVPNAIPRVSKNVHREIIEHLQALNNNTYLWLHLSLEHIKGRDKGHRTARKLKELIDELPPTLEEAYDYMLSKSKDADLTRSLLSIVISAARPLSVEETSIALELDRSNYHHHYIEDLDLESTEDFENSIKDLCGALISIHDSRVYFVHETARAFLLARPGSDGTPDFAWKHCIQDTCAKQLLAKVCISYLSLRDFELEASGLTYGQDSSRHKTGGSKVRLFLEYAATNWVMHYRETQAEVHDKVAEQLRKIVPATSTLPGYWSHIYEPRPYAWVNWMRPLMFCAGTGLYYMIEQLLAEGVNVEDSKNHRMRRGALHIASWMGYAETARVLLQHGARVDSLSLHDVTSLHLAAENGHAETISLLFEYGANILQQDVFDHTALQNAARGGHLGAVQALIRYGADVNAIDRDGRTPLDDACNGGYFEVALFLLEHGAHIDAQEDYMESPLHSAAGNGHTRIVHLLLQHGASVNSLEKYEQQTALHKASFGDYEDVIRVLLQNGADASIRDRARRTAFHLAKLIDRANAMRVLRELGADATYNEDVASGALNPDYE